MGEIKILIVIFFFILVSANFVKFHELFISRYFVRFLNVDNMRSMLPKVCECSFHDDCEHSFCFKGDFFLFIVSYLVSIVAWHWLLNVNYCLPSPIVPSHHLSLLFVTNYYHCLLSQGIVVWSFLLVVIDGYYMPLLKVHVHLLLLFPCWSYSSLVVVVDILLLYWISPHFCFMHVLDLKQMESIQSSTSNNKQGKFYF
jgi:hypothetical protein